MTRLCCVLAAMSLLASCKAFSGGKGGAFSVVGDTMRDRLFDSLSARIVEDMSDETAAGQLLLTGVDGASLTSRSAKLLASSGVGGVMLFKYNLGRGGAAARRLAEECGEAGSVIGEERRILPFVAVDHEGGDVHRFGRDATRLPAAAAFGKLLEKSGEGPGSEALRGAAYRAGLELRALGVTLNMAPVAEVSDERNAAFLGDRSYGSAESSVAAAAGAFVAGMDRAGVACAVKHFPGNAGADPHGTVSVISGDRGGLERMVAPFKDVIASSRPAAVMVSHAIVAAVDPDRPGSLSKAVMTDWLKGKLGFRGLVVTDDLRMGAIAATGRSPERAAVEAVAGGADLVMTWPMDIVAVRAALVEAVQKGSLPRERLRDAARRVVAMKLRYGLCPPREMEPVKATDTDATLARFREETERYLRERGLQ